MNGRTFVDRISQVGIIKNRSFEDTPCFRRSFMYGILSGFGLGLTHFMFTSKFNSICFNTFSSFIPLGNVTKSTKLVVYSGTGISLVYWFYCRHDTARTKFFYNRLGPELQKIMDERGIDQSPQSEECSN